MQKKVLYCEDDEGIGEILKIVLEDNGYAAANIVGVTDIAKKVADEKPDLLLMDLWLTNTRGQDVAERIKTNPQTASTPIIIMSADYNIATIAKQSGVDGYLKKPFDIEMLLTIVKEYTT